MSLQRRPYSSTELCSSPRSELLALVVESDRTLARQIQSALESAGIKVMRPFSSVRDATSAMDSPPDVLVIDLAMTHDDDAWRELLEQAAHRGSPIVYVSGTADRATLERAAERHAASCVIKPFSDRQIVSAVLLAAMTAQRTSAALAARRAVVDEKLRAIAAIANDGLAGDEPAATGRAGRLPAGLAGLDHPDQLSARERQIVDLLANGARVVTIARRLELSPHTVRNHLKSVFRKLNLHGQHELFEYWHQHAG